jgi:hypothetical protein
VEARQCQARLLRRKNKDCFQVITMLLLLLLLLLLFTLDKTN